MPLTKGFRIGKLLDHFDRHRLDFPTCADQYDYLDLADKFLGGALPASAKEGRRRNGDLVRYDPSTQEFGILASDGFVKTYYLLKRPKAMEYFEQECRR